MDKETFLSYRHYLWFWICLFGLVVLWGLYLVDKPLGGPNGSTVIGYTYGAVATGGILFLMYYGIRKRSYYAKATTVKGMLSAHVWVGLSLIFIVPLHAGFHFGINVHTLAYVLMLITIFSGLWGVFLYEKLPLVIQSQRGGGTMHVLLEQIQGISSDIDKVAGLESAEERLAPKSDAFLVLLRKIDFRFQPSMMRCLRHGNPRQIDRKIAANFLQTLPESEQKEGLKLIGLANKKREMVCRLQDEARVLAWIRAWLFMHLPISFGLLALVAIHIFSVFYY